MHTICTVEATRESRTTKPPEHDKDKHIPLCRIDFRRIIFFRKRSLVERCADFYYFQKTNAIYVSTIMLNN